MRYQVTFPSLEIVREGNNIRVLQDVSNLIGETNIKPTKRKKCVPGKCSD